MSLGGLESLTLRLGNKAILRHCGVRDRRARGSQEGLPAKKMVCLPGRALRVRLHTLRTHEGWGPNPIGLNESVLEVQWSIVSHGRGVKVPYGVAAAGCIATSATECFAVEPSVYTHCRPITLQQPHRQVIRAFVILRHPDDDAAPMSVVSTQHQRCMLGAELVTVLSIETWTDLCAAGWILDFSCICATLTYRDFIQRRC